LELTVVNDEELKADSENPEPGDQAQLDSAEEPIAEMVEDIAEAVEDLAEAEITLDTLHDELSQAKDAALRAQAEAQNARRRSEQDVERARKYALERFSGDLLTVVDNLERAAEAAAGSEEEAVKPIAEGVNLTLKSMLDVLGKYHIETIDPMGEPFDPKLHQAMTMVPNPDMEPNTVMDVMQRGYSLSGRLLRPAMVIVSKAPD
jgi:molecular chaperone GrpE